MTKNIQQKITNKKRKKEKRGKEADEGAQESEEKGIPNPLNEKVLKKLEKMRKDMSKLKLNQEFNIDVEKYLLPEADTSMVPPLPEQPQPNPAMVQTPPPVTQTGLTPTEQALLSEEERMIALRNRGLV